MNKLKVLDLFSGIGSWTLGMDRTGGYETIAFCEIDKHARNVISKHYPNIPIFTDIKELGYTHIYDGEAFLHHINPKTGKPLLEVFSPQIDVITASFPCTDLSIAGKQKGLVDEEGNPTRSGLWFETARLIRQIKPRFVLIENVANLLKLGFDQVLSDLSSLGYICEWHVIRATDVGLPHQRERLFIIAHTGEFRRDECIGEERYIQTDKERSSKEIYPEGTECIAESKQIRPLLSARTFESFRASNSGRATALSGIRRVTDGIPTGIYEAHRRQRIKQLGNAIIPDIAHIIGQAILDRLNET